MFVGLLPGAGRGGGRETEGGAGAQRGGDGTGQNPHHKNMVWVRGDQQADDESDNSSTDGGGQGASAAPTTATTSTGPFSSPFGGGGGGGGRSGTQAWPSGGTGNPNSGTPFPNATPTRNSPLFPGGAAVQEREEEDEVEDNSGPATGRGRSTSPLPGTRAGGRTSQAVDPNAASKRVLAFHITAATKWNDRWVAAGLKVSQVSQSVSPLCWPFERGSFPGLYALLLPETPTHLLHPVVLSITPTGSERTPRWLTPNEWA